MKYSTDTHLEFLLVGHGGAGNLPADLTLTIRPLPAEDLSTGRIMRQCLFEGNQEINDQFDFRWLDHNGRVVTNGDALYLMVRRNSHPPLHLPSSTRV